ncbi:unnamed protein product, partial [Cyprideis torosa]
IELTGDNHLQLFIPRGFLHGFIVQSEKAIFHYQCDNFYHKASEDGVHPLDPDLNINWGGANGQLGQSIQQEVAKQKPNHTEFVFLDLPEFDLCQNESVKTHIEKIAPDFVINCAAFTAVDLAESESEKAFALNAEAVGHLAKHCQAEGSTLIHISTDYVFDGKASHPYIETDPTNPINVYGLSKLKGEQLAMEGCDKVFVIRTSWLYSAFGNNFVKTMLRLFKEKDSLNIVGDQHGCPTSAHDLAKVCLELVAQNITAYGVYHFSNTQPTTWYHFCCEIAKQVQSNIALNPIPTASYPTPAQRPMYSVMNCGKIETLLNEEIQSWQEALSKVLDQLAK